MKIPFNEVIQPPVAHQINNVPEVIFKMAKKNVEYLHAYNREKLDKNTNYNFVMIITSYGSKISHITLKMKQLFSLILESLQIF